MPGHWSDVMFSVRPSLSPKAMALVVGTFIQVRMVLYLRSSKIRKGPCIHDININII